MSLRRGIFRKRIKNKFGHIIKFKNISYNDFKYQSDEGSTIDYKYICIVCGIEVILVSHKNLNKRRKNKRKHYYIPGYLTCNEILIKKLLE